MEIRPKLIQEALILQQTDIQQRAVLDFIGLPVSVPGNLECRFQLGVYRDGSWIDDGSRSGQVQREKHRVVLSRGQNVRSTISKISAHLATMDYEAPDIGLIRHIAQHEWKHEVITARRRRLKPSRPQLRLVVRALGFDIEGRGELAIGLGKVTVSSSRVNLTQKSSVLLQPGDPVPLVFEALDLLAEQIGYEKICEEDRSLIEYVAHQLWTAEVVNHRKTAWALADALNGEQAEQAHMIEFVQRLNTMEEFYNKPVSAVPVTEPMRIQ